MEGALCWVVIRAFPNDRSISICLCNSMSNSFELFGILYESFPLYFVAAAFFPLVGSYLDGERKWTSFSTCSISRTKVPGHPNISLLQDRVRGPGACTPAYAHDAKSLFHFCFRHPPFIEFPLCQRVKIYWYTRITQRWRV